MTDKIRLTETRNYKRSPHRVVLSLRLRQPGNFASPGTNYKQLLRTEEEANFTISVNEYIFNEPLIKTAFSGHYHGMGGTASMGEKEGYVLAPLFKGIVGEITID